MSTLDFILKAEMDCWDYEFWGDKILSYLQDKQIQNIDDTERIPALVKLMEYCKSLFADELMGSIESSDKKRLSRKYEKLAVYLWNYYISSEQNDLAYDVACEVLDLFIDNALTIASQKRLKSLLLPFFHNNNNRMKEFIEYMATFADPLPSLWVMDSFCTLYKRRYHSDPLYLLFIDNNTDDKESAPALVKLMEDCRSFINNELMSSLTSSEEKNSLSCDYEKTAVYLWNYYISSEQYDLAYDVACEVFHLFIYNALTIASQKRLEDLLLIYYFNNHNRMKGLIVYMTTYANPLPSLWVLDSFCTRYERRYHSNPLHLLYNKDRAVWGDIKSLYYNCLEEMKPGFYYRRDRIRACRIIRRLSYWAHDQTFFSSMKCYLEAWDISELEILGED